MTAPRLQPERGRLQVGQCAPGIAAGQPDQVGQRGVVQADRARQPAVVAERPPDDLPHVLVAERLQGEQQGPGQQRADHRERRVLGGRADEGHPAVLHRGQQGVLLRLVEPVHLVDEQHGLRAGQAELPAGRLDRRPDVLDPGGDRGQLGEPAAGHLADHVGQRGLPGARRAPQQHGHARVVLGQLAQRGARAGQVGLADHLVQGVRAHPHGQRGRRPGRFLLSGVEQAARLPATVRAPYHTQTLCLR